MSNVVALRPCRGCGGPARRVELAHRGEVFVTVDICGACVDKGQEELARVRPVFDAMVAAGVPRDVANDTMTYMLGRLGP